MAEPFRILILEDNPADATLVQFELQEAGFVFTAKVVMTKKDFVHELQDFSPDLILSDYDLPQFNGALALAEAKKRCPGTPFILVTGAVTEDRAIEILTQGAKDYVLKSRLQQKLGPAVKRALAEAEEHKARKRAEEELREANRTLEERVKNRTAELETEVAGRKKIEEERERLLAEVENRAAEMDATISSMATGLIVYNAAGKAIRMNNTAKELLPHEIFFNMTVEERARVIRWETEEGKPFPLEDIPVARALRGETTHNVVIAASFPDRKLWISASAAPIRTPDGQMLGAVASFIDITESKQAEAALRESESRERVRAAELQAVMDTAQVAIWIAHDPQCLKITGNKYADEIMHVPPDANISASVVPGEAAVTYRVFRNGLEMKPEELPAQIAASTGRPVAAELLDLVFSDGRVVTTILGAMPLFDAEGRVRGSVAAGADLTRLRKAEEALRQTTERFDMAQHAAEVGTWDWNIITGEIKWSYQMFNLFRLDPRRNIASFELWESIIHPEDIKTASLRIEKALSQKTTLNSDYRIVLPDGQTRWINAVGESKYDEQGQPIRMIGICSDITDRKKAEDTLQTTFQRLHALVSNMHSSILFVGEGGIELANQAFCDYFELPETPADLIGLTSNQLIEKIKNAYLHPEEAIKRIQEIVDRRQPVIGEETTLQGGRTCLRDFIPIYMDGKSYGRLWHHTDITERKNREKEQEKFSRTLRALNKSNQAMMRAVDECEYMEEVCKIIVEDCGYTMVWVGFAQNDKDKMVRPVAYSGFEEGYINALKVTWADTERGRGPTGTAIRTGKLTACRNMLTDPRFQPWRKEAMKRGYASSIALPLTADGKAFGALTLYSKEPDHFAEDEINLLAELADDFSYGITALRWRAAREEAEEALRESEEKYRNLVKYAPAAIYEMDLQGTKFLSVNDVMCDILGYSREELLSMKPTDFLSQESRSLFKDGIKKKMTGEKIDETIEYHVRRKDGEWIYIAVNVGALSYTNEKSPRIAVIAHDITKRKRAEQSLKEQATKLEELNQELESFSYSVSHDLRAPLRAIDGFSRKLEREYGDELDEKFADTVNVIRSNTKLMGVLIDDLLAFSRVQKTGMSISAIDMDKLVGEVWKGIREANKERELKLKITKILPGYGDRALIKQVLSNLFDNAVKFTKNRKQSIIEMSSYKEADKIIYCIKDNGAGFDMAYYNKLFGVFQRLHSHEEYEGTGVGLAIVQRIINRHGGRVWAEGKVDKGATFYFTLPAHMPSR